MRLSRMPSRPSRETRMAPGQRPSLVPTLPPDQISMPRSTPILHAPARSSGFGIWLYVMRPACAFQKPFVSWSRPSARILSGLDKTETVEKHGPEQVLIWRRSYATPPPPMPDDHGKLPR